MPYRAVLAMILFSLAASAPASDRAKVRKPRLGVRATPVFSFTPANVFVTAQLTGGDDVEVYGLSVDALKDVLARAGRVNAVGEAFTVFKLSGLEGVAGDVDVSLPRRDSKVGPGHRGIAVHGDPGLSPEEAARRRDFTVNALLFDPFADELLDFFGGRRDLDTRVLRAVDPSRFGDDPLRALRAVQLAA